MSLIVKYRPKSFKDMIGNKHVVKSVESLMKKKKAPHSWMFTGMSGCGKTTIARIVAKELGAKRGGIFEINASDLSGVDSVREVIHQANFRVPGSPVSVYIFDEAQRLTTAAQNATLKLLEDPPAHAYFIIATTDPHKILGTIRTRCTEFRFEPVSTDDLVDLVLDVAEAEGMKIDEEIILEIAVNAAGSPRLALNMLERCSVVKGIDEARKLISGLGIDFQVEGEFTISGEIFDAMLSNKNVRSAWKEIGPILDKQVLKAGVNADAIRQGLTSRMGRFLLKTANLNVAEAVLILETNQNMYSNASFVAVMLSVVNKYYESPTNVRKEIQSNPR